MNFSGTSVTLIKWSKNSTTSCWCLVENSGWPLPTKDLNMAGLIPDWCCWSLPANSLRSEYRPDSNPHASLLL